jgi:streptogramin lyase
VWDDRLVRIPLPRERRLASLALAVAGVLGIAAPAHGITPTITEFSQGLTAFSDPSSITVGPDGSLWFVEYPSPGRIGKITTAGAITEVATGGVTPNFTSNPQISGIEPGADGQLWFTEGHNPGRVGRINPTTGAVQEMDTGGVSPGFSVNAGPEEIGLGADGNMWFAEVGNPNAAIARITTSGVITEFSTGLTANSVPNAMTPVAAADGNMWFTETRSGANAIGRLDPSTGAITEFSSGLVADGSVRDIVPGPGGDVWFAQFNNPGYIGKITPSGAITEVATGGVTPGFTANQNPDGIATGPDGALWFTEFHQPSGPAAIGRLDPATGSVTEFPTPTANSGPMQIVQGPDGNMWFTEFGATKIGRITTPPLASTTGATGVTATSATITGTADGHAQPTSFHIDYGPIGGPTTGTAEQPLGTSAVSGALTGLSPGTNYQARVVVTNPTGSTAGAFVQFTTPVSVPKVSRLRQSAKRWREGKALPRISRARKPPVGTTFSFVLNQDARARFLFQLLTQGRFVGHRCRPQTNANRHRPRCQHPKNIGSISFQAHTGLNKVRFQGRLSKRKRLKPGRYAVVVSARNSQGKASNTSQLRFTIVR